MEYMFFQMQKNKSAFKVLVVALLCFALIASVSGCGQQSRPSDIDTNTEGSSSQLHSFLIPKSLLGGQDAADVESQFNDSSTTVLLESGSEVPIKSVYASIRANEDGTATYDFTDEQLKSYLNETACTASLSRFISEDSSEYIASTSIKSTEFTDDGLTGIIVYVDGSLYDNSGTDGVLANIYTTGYMGLYQVMSGVDPYEWHVHVTVKDYETNEIITEDDYPTDR